MSLGSIHRSRTAEEYPGKRRKPSMKAVRPVIIANRGPYLQLSTVGQRRKEELRRKKGMKEEKDGVGSVEGKEV